MCAGKLGSLGSYTGVKAQWHAGKNTKYTTTLMNFKESLAIGFRVTFPAGASDTAIFNSTDKASQSRTITNFPAFTDYVLKDILSWCVHILADIMICYYVHISTCMHKMCPQAGQLHARGQWPPISGTSRGTDGETLSGLSESPYFRTTKISIIY